MQKRFRVVSANLNGIRSAAKKGFFDWLAQHQADVVCVQELKAHEGDLEAAMRDAACATGATLPGRFHCAQKKGYSGVGVYSRTEPTGWGVGFGCEEFDAEGRVLEARFDDTAVGPLSVVSVYLPSGSSGEERQQAKFRCLAAFLPWLQDLKASGREVILCGDFNIAHKEIDLKNWKSNQKNSGFLPEERAWLTHLFDEAGFVDVFRTLDQRPEQYTWWSNRGQAWAKNVGWRLDYQIATPGIAARARATSIWTETRFSDHAPLTIDYDMA